ncbi:TetR/AcrR family transcriptional regulator [Frankia nepalensis]|uniref:TetR/AcrR family transcriptional regulator n=1 Tax=Frankia nepalensis TaxID=1836974 RepID=A0A937UTE6_9ACTN|nr:TetR/AcrR family transcriptional regulator [Frankia nepalensis]MBL7502656.1 TetR/AcrR family transcriptional regulator [Frankia nepalensis]MBL7514882.1 TetR/AcrR family transcriptional regulator [Frankia nepalensis]MBL7633028.1 TetR/AcrR family transcriptional regulator [Frankia nepalensis]
MDAKPTSSARSRTERAIVTAAVGVWVRDRTATLPQIAEAAQVGRTTLHRYFPERDGLLRAAVEHALEAVGRAIAEAEPDRGHPLEAMRRVVAALASVSEAIMFVFGDQALMRDVVPTADPDPPTPRDPVIDLIRRGQAEGVFDDQLSAEWLQQVLWAVSYTAFEQVELGALAKFDVAATVSRTLEQGITTRAGCGADPEARS